MPMRPRRVVAAVDPVGESDNDTVTAAAEDGVLVDQRKVVRTAGQSLRRYGDQIFARKRKTAARQI